MATGKALDGKPYAGNPHVRFDEGEAASTATSRRGSQLYSMSKLITLAAVAASAAMLMAANADEYTDSYGQTWSYTVGDDGKSVTLTDVADRTISYDAANIPWTFLKDGMWYTVTSIGPEAIGRTTQNLRWTALYGELSIPASVTNIGESAFIGCSGLSGVKFAEGVRTIGQKAFASAVNATGVSGALVIPASVDTLALDFMYYGGLAVKAAWFKGKPTATSGVQQYSEISPYRTILYSPCAGMTVLFGPNTKLSYSSSNFFHSNANGCTVFLPENGQHASKWNFGGTNTKVVKYGEGQELDLDIDEAAGKITATVKTTDALSAVLNSAANFKTYFGLDTRIEVTNALDIAAGTITAAQLQYATFNSLMLAVKTQDQLNSILGVVPASVPVSIDPTGATQNLSVSTADGRKVYVLLPENGTYKLRPDGLVISFH